MSNRSFDIIREAQAKNIAFVLDNLNGKDIIIQFANALVEKGYAVTIFCLEQDTLIKGLNCAMEQLDNLWSFGGHVFCFDLNLTRYVVKCPGQKKIYFYDPILSWTLLNSVLYYDIASVYLHPRLTLICNSQNEKIVKQVWKQPKVVDNLTVESLTNCLI